VKVLDYDEHEGLPFLVMEFVDGISLAEHIESRLFLANTKLCRSSCPSPMR